MSYVIDIGSMMWQEMRDRPWRYGYLKFVDVYGPVDGTYDLHPLILNHIFDIDTVDAIRNQ